MSFNSVGGFGPQLLFLNRLDMYIGCSCHVCLCMTCALSCLFYAKLQTFLHSRKICKQKLCLLTFERRVVGELLFFDQVEEYRGEDGRGLERMREDGRG